MSDRIAVLNAGKVAQFARPGELYDRPSSVFVNRFVGTTNLIPGTLTARKTGCLEITLANGETVECENDVTLTRGSEVLLSVRPERLIADSRHDAKGIPGEVVAVMPLGPAIVYEIDAGGEIRLKVTEPRRSRDDELSIGDRVRVRPAAMNDCTVFPAAQAPGWNH